MNEQQVTTLCSKSDNNMNIELNCITNNITKQTQFKITGTVRQS